MSTIGGAVVNAAAVIILRSGRASDPRLVAGAFAIYTSAKRAGQLNGELFGNQLDQLLKSEYDIDVDKYLEEQLEQNIMPILEEYFGYKDTWTEWFDSLVEPDLTQSQDYPSFDDMVNYDSNNPNNFNPPTDTDGDGTPDSEDPYPNDASPDSDGDGVPDNSDSHPNDPNQGSTDDDNETDPENGDGHPLDPTDFTPPRRDPLVLDLDKDGFIATTSLEDLLHTLT